MKTGEENKPTDKEDSLMPPKESVEDSLDSGNTEALSSQLEKAYSENESIQNKYLRSMADLENLRKRSIRDREDAVTRTRIQLFSDLLPVIDSFKLGLMEAEKTESGKEIALGFSLAMNQFEEAMKEYGLEIIEPSNVEFDPSIHEAIGYEDSSEHKEGMVFKCIRSGYRLKSNLLRPASVILTKNSTPKDE